jgi:hypothetical protein
MSTEPFDAVIFDFADCGVLRLPGANEGFWLRIQANDITVHIVLDDFGDRLGRAYRETDEAAA